MKCPQCDIEMEIVDSGTYQDSTWYHYECPFCDYCYTAASILDNVSKSHDNN